MSVRMSYPIYRRWLSGVQPLEVEVLHETGSQALVRVWREPGAPKGEQRIAWWVAVSALQDEPLRMRRRPKRCLQVQR
jgi:hypothetical protein